MAEIVITDVKGQDAVRSALTGVRDQLDQLHAQLSKLCGVIQDCNNDAALDLLPILLLCKAGVRVGYGAACNSEGGAHEVLGGLAEAQVILALSASDRLYYNPDGELVIKRPAKEEEAPS